MRALAARPEVLMAAPRAECGAARALPLSVIIPVLRDCPGIEAVHRVYRDILTGDDRPLEFIYVLDRAAHAADQALDALKTAGEPLTVIVLSRWDGETAALRSGLRHATGEIILTLPPTLQVDPAELPKVLEALPDCDMAAAFRPAAHGVESSLFHGLIRTLFGRSFKDLACRVRASRRQVLEEVADHSAQQHFLPLLAAARGFRIREVEVQGGTASAGFSLTSRLRLALDVLALFMVLKFVRRPLRFFGAFGVPILAAGLLFTSWLALARLAFGVPLADRPALILGVLLIVLGIQVIALGLIGEIIIFASGRRIKDYDIERIV